MERDGVTVRTRMIYKNNVGLTQSYQLFSEVLNQGINDLFMDS